MEMIFKLHADDIIFNSKDRMFFPKDHEQDQKTPPSSLLVYISLKVLVSATSQLTTTTMTTKNSNNDIGI